MTATAGPVRVKPWESFSDVVPQISKTIAAARQRTLKSASPDGWITAGATNKDCLGMCGKIIARKMGMLG